MKKSENKPQTKRHFQNFKKIKNYHIKTLNSHFLKSYEEASNEKGQKINPGQN